MAGIAQWWLKFRWYVAITVVALYLASLTWLALGGEWQYGPAFLTVSLVCLLAGVLTLPALSLARRETTRLRRRWTTSATGVVVVEAGLLLAGIVWDIVVGIGDPIGAVLMQACWLVSSLTIITGWPGVQVAQAEA